MTPNTTKGSGDAPRTNPPIYLADMDRCLPSSALTRKSQRFHWTMLDFETDAAKGTLLFAGEETQAPELTYPLEREGWYDIHIGFFNTAWRPYEDQRLWAKLKDDPAYSLIRLRPPSDLPWGVPPDDQVKGPRIQDVFWKTADLTQQTILFRQPCLRVVEETGAFGNPCPKVWIAYLKLVPLSKTEVQELLADRSRSENKRLFAYNDSWVTGDRGDIMPEGESNAASIKSHLEPYRHSDFSRIYWDGAHGDMCNYLTEIGRMWIPEHVRTDDPPRLYDRLTLVAWDEYVKKDIDPFQVAADFSHEIGLEFHACYRLGWRPFYWPPPFEEFNLGGFYDQHPELRCVGRDGRDSLGLSFAFDETQQFVLSLIGEMASYPIDGVCMLYNRQPPFMEYEAPLVDGFQSEYGEDPRELDEADTRWLAYRSQFLTRFMRKLRQNLDDLAGKQQRSQPYPVSAWVFGSEEENLFYGIDVRGWLEQGLVDTLIPYTSAKKLFSFELAWEKPSDVEYWLSLTQGTQCQVAFNLMPRDMDARQYRRKANALYQLGVEHLAFWDTAITGGRDSEALRRLGHREEIAEWISAGEQVLERPSSPLRKLERWDLDYFPE